MACQKIYSITFIWMQGERDAREMHGEFYAESLRGLVSQISDDLQRKDINLVIGRLSDFGVNRKLHPHWEMVRQAQVEVAEAYPYGAWIDTDDLNSGINKKGRNITDGIHYSVEGYKVLAKRFADKSIELIKLNSSTHAMNSAPISWPNVDCENEQ